MEKRAGDIGFMAEALKEAKKALKKDEVPIGAVLVLDGEVISRGHNKRETSKDPLGHAELAAIKSASRKLGAWRLSGATLYVTLEPCVMCMGAILQARISRVVFGPFDPKAGACGSLYDLSNDPRLNHRVKVASGVLKEESSLLLKEFFARLRTQRKTLKK